MKKYPMAKTHLASCRHEAAHCVLAERFGMKVVKVCAPKSRGKHKGGMGYVLWRRSRKMGPLQVSVVFMAGSVAEHLWHGTPKGLVSAYDLQDLKKSGLKGEDFRIVWEETSRMVRRLKPEIWRLAKRLTTGEVIFR